MMPSIAAAKRLVSEEAPPLVSDELCACKIVTIDAAIEEFMGSESTDWFVRALKALARGEQLHDMVDLHPVSES